MMDRLLRSISGLMNRVRVNRVQRKVQDGAPVFIKRRRMVGSIVIWFGNRFLALAGSGIWMFVSAGEWVKWEIYCARLLYPGRSAVKKGRGASVIIPEVRGVSLRQLLRRNEPCEAAFAAAALELKRAHQIQCEHFGAAWSHGDLHLDNILYDVDGGRAFLIDFDTRHDFRLSAIRRQSDDLHAMLLELMGLSDERWRVLAPVILEEYRDVGVLEELAKQLVIPRGFAKIFWDTRTNGAPTGQVEERLRSVLAMIQRIVTRSGAAPDRGAVEAVNRENDIVCGIADDRA